MIEAPPLPTPSHCLVGECTFWREGQEKEGECEGGTREGGMEDGGSMREVGRERGTEERRGLVAAN